MARHPFEICPPRHLHRIWLVFGGLALGLGPATLSAQPAPMGTRVRLDIDGSLAPPLEHRWFLLGPLTYWGDAYLELVDDRQAAVVRVPRERIAKLAVSTGRTNQSGKGLIIGGLAGALVGLVLHEESAQGTNSDAFLPRGRWLAAWGGAIGGGLGFLIGTARAGPEGWRTVPHDIPSNEAR